MPSFLSIRMALGAQKGDVLLRVLLSTIGVVGVGAASGMGLYMLVNRVVAQWAHALADDPLSLTLVAPLLLCGCNPGVLCTGASRDVFESNECLTLRVAELLDERRWSLP